MKKQLLTDGARLLNGLGGLVSGAKSEIDQAMKNKLLAQLHEIGFVPRDEFEAVRALALELTQNYQALADRLQLLEAQFQQLTKNQTNGDAQA